MTYPRDYELDLAFERGRIADETPEPESATPPPVRGTRLPCPHCGWVTYFGIGETPGLDRDHDFELMGLTICCQKPVRIRCGQKTAVVKL